MAYEAHLDKMLDNDAAKRAVQTVADLDAEETTCPACETTFATAGVTHCPECGLRFGG